MTRTTNARLAGVVFLLYIATGLTTLYLSGRATGSGETAARLAAIAEHEGLMRVTIPLLLLQALYALVLAVTIYALTRDVDRDLAIMAMCCRVAEGVVGAIAPLTTLGLLSIATGSAATSPADSPASQVIGGLLLRADRWTALVAATCFAVGGTIYSYLFLRGRSIPVWLAWLGVVSSALLVALLPLQLAGFARGPVTDFMWLPILVFELVLAVWLIVKGVAPPARSQTP